MKLFMERLIYSIKKELKAWSIALLVAIPFMIIVFVVGYVVILLPMQFLENYIGKYSPLWAGVLAVVVISIGNWESIKKWFDWQFIEPFKKESK